MSLNEFLQRYAHLLLHSARGIDMSTYTVELGAVVTLPAKRGKPVSTTTTYCLRWRQYPPITEVEYVVMVVRNLQVLLPQSPRWRQWWGNQIRRYRQEMAASNEVYQLSLQDFQSMPKTNNVKETHPDDNIH